MRWSSSKRIRSVRAPISFIDPCRPKLADRPPSGPLWVHEIKHDGYRMQIHVRDGRVRLYTMTGVDWTDRYPWVVESASKIKGSAIIDAEAVVADADGVSDFGALHARGDDKAVHAYAFDLMMRDDDDLRRLPLQERKAALLKIVGRRAKGGLIYNDHIVEDGPTIFRHVCTLGMEGIVSKRIDSRYRSGSNPNWLKTKNPKSPAMLRIEDGTF